jgi:hypothetical protein
MPFFVLLHLLESDADLLCEALLAHPRRKAPHAQTAAYVPVDGICNVGLGHSHPIIGLYRAV